MTKFSPLMAHSFFFIFVPLSISSLYFFLIDYSILIDWHIAPILTSFLSFPIIFDWIRLLFSSTVIFISINILKFSSSYIKNDPFIKRFTILVIFFILSINILIFFPHIITLLLGWDGLGFTSFVLVIYYQNPKSLSAGIITVLTNRIGDALILIRIALIGAQGHWNIFSLIIHPTYSLIFFLIVCASLTKRAQLPFSRWLPAAIAAPTPVSALVHSSTLVTAGVFLLIRFYPLISRFSWFSNFLLLSATLTITISRLAAAVEWDFKKIIALSTLRQLGIIIGSLALGYPLLTFFHLITHALFKALLFVCAGNIIFTHSHIQDLRTMGNLTYQIPITITCFSIANISLIGIPFLAGFYSKDLILESVIKISPNFLILILFSISSGLTTIYSIRFITHLTMAQKNSRPILLINNSDWNFNYRIIDLTFGAIFMGSALYWVIFFPLTLPTLTSIWKLTPIILILLGVYAAYFIETMRSLMSPNFPIKKLNSSMWFLSPLSSETPKKIIFPLSGYIIKNLEFGWFEKLGIHGLKTSLSFISKTQHLLSSSLIIRYSSISLLTIILIFFLCVE